MSLKTRTEIHQDTLEFDKYIHSNSENFFKILTKSNLKDGADSNTIKGVLKDLKQQAIRAVQEEINFFLAVENEFIGKVNSTKNTNFTRATYLEELRKVRTLFTQDPDYSAFVLFDIKDNLAKAKPFDNYQKLVKDKILQPISKKNFKKAEQKKNKNVSNKEIDILYDSYIKEMEAAVKKEEKNLKDIVDKVNKETAELKKIVIERFLQLIEFISEFYDPTTDMVISKDPTFDNSIINPSKGILEIAKSLGFDYNPGDALDQVLKEFKEDLLSLGSVEFFRVFQSSKGVLYFDKYIKAFQFESKLGSLFEFAVKNSFTKLIEVQHPLAAIFLDKSDIQTLGAGVLKDTNPIDLGFGSYVKDGRKMSLGLSLKLKDNADIKLENTPIENYIWKQEEVLGSSKEAYNYIKRNLKALNTFDNYNTSLIDELATDFLIFEKEFVVLTVMTRWLAGLFKKISENQYQSADKKGNPTEEDFYTAFIFDTKDVYSVADILQGILNIIQDDKLDAKNGISVSLQSPLGNIEADKPLVSSQYKFKDPGQLKKLYKQKQKVFRSLSNVTYALILADSNISSIIKDMDAELNELTFSKATLSLNVNNIKNIIGGL